MNRRALSARQKWIEIVRRQQASGLSVATFCRHHGVAVSSLFAWKRRLNPGGRAAAFVEAKIVAAPGQPRPVERAESLGGVIEIVLRGERRVRVHGGVDRDLLAQVLSAVEGLA